MVVVAYERGSFTRESNCRASVGEVLVFFFFGGGGGGGSLMGCGHQREELVPHGGLTQVLFTITDEVTSQIL